MKPVPAPAAASGLWRELKLELEPEPGTKGVHHDDAMRNRPNRIGYRTDRTKTLNGRLPLEHGSDWPQNPPRCLQRQAR